MVGVVSERSYRGIEARRPHEWRWPAVAPRSRRSLSLELGPAVLSAAKRFCQDILGLDVLMNLDRDLRLIQEDERAGQHCVRRWLGTPVPDLSIEVDELNAALQA
jgi:hypothetical protein